MEGPTRTEIIFKPELIGTRQYREGATLYIFKKIGAVVDTSGKNYKPLLELFFGPYDNLTDTESLDQPDSANEGVNIEYVSRCIQSIAQVTGIREFWFYPYGDDSPLSNTERRSRARLELVVKHSHNIKLAPEGHGYILTL